MLIGSLRQLFLMSTLTVFSECTKFPLYPAHYQRQNSVSEVRSLNSSELAHSHFHAPRKTNTGETTRYGVRNEICPTGLEPQRNADGNIMWCRLDAECRNNYECVPIVGLIHFGTSVKYCCPTKSSYCTKKPSKLIDISSCTKPALTLYYFDVTRRACRPYLVARCNKEDATVDEVQNRFGSLKDCRAKCESTACEVGEIPLYLDEDLNRPFLCESTEYCPRGYICRLDRLFRRQVCCGRTQFDPCPNYRTFIVPFTGKPKQCQQSSQFDMCPNDYVCTSTSTNPSSYCCTNIQGVCPASQKPYIHPLTGNAIKCNSYSYDAACPPGYVCQPTVVGASFGFCCSKSVVFNCPPNTKPFINVATNLPQKCTVGVTTCSHGYQCQNTEPNSQIGYCCTPPSSMEHVIQTIAPYPRRTTTLTPASSSAETVEETAAESHGNEDQNEKPTTTTTPSPISSLEMSKETSSPLKKTETMIRKKILQVINTLTCPEDFEPMTYPGTTLILHCTRGHANDCPAPSKCLKAVEDVLERALCCVHRDDKPLLKTIPNSGSNEMSSFKIVEDNIQLGESTDPTCPTIILSRGCSPGTVHICKEEGFFCQYNKQFKEFLCCSQYKSVGNKLMYNQVRSGYD